jgi:hypothetical protein
MTRQGWTNGRIDGFDGLGLILVPDDGLNEPIRSLNSIYFLKLVEKRRKCIN